MLIKLEDLVRLEEMAIHFLNYKVKQGRPFLRRLLEEAVEWRFCIISGRKNKAHATEESRGRAVTAKRERD